MTLTVSQQQTFCLLFLEGVVDLHMGRDEDASISEPLAGAPK